MKFVWVIGSKVHGYELCVSLVKATAAYHRMDHYRFDNYREAQDLANAINAALATAKKRKKQKEAKP